MFSLKILFDPRYKEIPRESMAKFVRHNKVLFHAVYFYFIFWRIPFNIPGGGLHVSGLPCHGTYLFFDFPGLIQLNKLTVSLFPSSLTFLIVFRLISFTVFGRTCSFRNVSSSLHLVTSLRRPLLTLT